MSNPKRIQCVYLILLSESFKKSDIGHSCPTKSMEKNNVRQFWGLSSGIDLMQMILLINFHSPIVELSSHF